MYSTIKKILCIALAVLALSSLCACGDMTSTNDKSTQKTESKKPLESPVESPDNLRSPSALIPSPSLPETLPNLTPDNNTSPLPDDSVLPEVSPSPSEILQNNR